MGISDQSFPSPARRRRILILDRILHAHSSFTEYILSSTAYTRPAWIRFLQPPGIFSFDRYHHQFCHTPDLTIPSTLASSFRQRSPLWFDKASQGPPDHVWSRSHTSSGGFCTLHHGTCHGPHLHPATADHKSCLIRHDRPGRPHLTSILLLRHHHHPYHRADLSPIDLVSCNVWLLLLVSA